MRRTRNQEREDWMDMTLSDWMDVSPTEWMDRALASWESNYADLMNTRPSEWWQRLYGSGMSQRPAFTGETGRRRWQYHGGGRAYPRKAFHHGRCHRCGSDPCECYCCLGDVDLAVYTHVGEQRVIQLVIENERHREKEITLEFNEWATRGGKTAPVETVLLEPKTFSLPPCGEQNVTLVIKISDAGEMRATDKAAAGDAEDTSQRKQLPDVDDCLVATADLRLVGCDHRPLRIAVAILPRDCDPYRVYCGCACC